MNKLFKVILVVSLFLTMSFCEFENQAQRPKNCAQYLHAVSRHENEGALFEVFSNNKKLETPNEQGIHIVVINQETSELVKQGNWNLKSVGDSEMIQFINDIEDNEVVVVGVHTDASQNLSENGYEALQKVGFTALKQLDQNEVFVLIGRKGNSQKGKINFENSEFAFQDLCLEECSILCDGCAEGQPEKCNSCFKFPGFLSINQTPPDCKPSGSKYGRVANSLVSSGKQMLNKVKTAFKSSSDSYTIDQVVIGSMMNMI